MNIEWLNKNRYRAYPFCEDSDFTIGMVSTDDELIFREYLSRKEAASFESLPFIEYSGISTFYTFPKYAFVDLSIVDTSINASDDASHVYLLGMEFTGAEAFLYLSHQGYFSSSIMFRIHTGEWTSDADYLYERCIGTMDYSADLGGGASFYTATKTRNILKQDIDIPNGTYRFKNPPQLIDSRVLRTGFIGVSGIGTAKPDYYGINTICLGRGCNSELHANDDNKVVLYVGTTWGECNCEQDIDDDTKCGSNMMFFNGQTADANGNIGIVGGPGITINPSGELIPVNSDDDSYSVPSITISASSSLLAAIGRDT